MLYSHANALKSKIPDIDIKLFLENNDNLNHIFREESDNDEIKKMIKDIEEKFDEVFYLGHEYLNVKRKSLKKFY